MLRTAFPIGPLGTHRSNGNARRGATSRARWVHSRPIAAAVAIGFSIPSSTVRDIVSQLIKTGTARHAVVGVHSATVTRQLDDEFNLGVDHGALVVAVIDSGPAAAAGVEQGDAIVKVQDAAMGSADDLIGALRREKSGDRVDMTVVRDQKEQALTVVLGRD